MDATKEDSELTRCNMETELQEVIAERDERNEEIANMKRKRLKRKAKKEHSKSEGQGVVLEEATLSAVPYLIRQQENRRTETSEDEKNNKKKRVRAHQRGFVPKRQFSPTLKKPNTRKQLQNVLSTDVNTNTFSPRILQP